MSEREDDARRAANNPVSSTTTTTTTGPTITATTYTSSGPQTTITLSGPNASTIVSPTVTTTHRTPVLQSPRSSVASQPERNSSIRIRRAGAARNTQDQSNDDEAIANRRRSFSEPERPAAALLKEVEDLEIRRHISASPLQTLHEEGSGYAVPQVGYYVPVVPERHPRRPAVVRQSSAISVRHARNLPPGEYESDVIDVLDVIGMLKHYPHIDCANH